MAQAKGYTCDHPDCDTFKVGETLPVGWISMRVQLEKGNDANSVMELCSNRCLALLAIDRAEADGTPVRTKATKTGGRPFKTDASLESARRNGRMTSHKIHHIGKGVVKEDCEFCQEITSPVGASV